MKIKNLEIRNFLVIGEAQLNLDSKGLVLVQGVNLDDTSSNSNGAGKSSIVDAISWCLYGQTARGESGDAVVNNKVGKDCFVQIELVDGHMEYLITRYRKHTVGKNELGVTYRNLELEEVGDLTKGTTALTQSLIESIVGCSYDVFVASTYSGQEAMPDLPNMTDKQLKMVIEEAAGIERLQKASDIATLRKNDAQSKLNDLSRERSAVLTAVEMGEKDRSTLQEKEAEFWESIKTKIESAKKDRETLVGKISLGSVTVALKGEMLEVEKEIADIKLKIKEAVGSEAEKKSEWASKVSKLKTELGFSESTLSEVLKITKDMKKSLDDVNLRVGQPCSECGKEYCEDDIEHAKKAAEEKLKQSLLSLKKIKQTKDERENALKIAQTARSDFEASMTDVSHLVKRSEELDAKLKELSKASSDIKDIERQIAALDKLIASKESEKSPYTDLIATRVKEVDFGKNKATELEEMIVAASAELDKLTEVVDVFGRSGVRAHILDTVTPFLNAKTAEYLGTLTDGNITANWSTISKTTKGELREKFGISVEKENGAKSFRGLSGGEKRKVRLATAMALQDLVANRATKSIEFQLFDEIDDAIDTSGLERLMTILDKRGREKGTVLVISHNDLNSYIDQFITVTNSGGISTVSGGGCEA